MRTTQSYAPWTGATSRPSFSLPPAAERALHELAESSDRNTRHAAQLALAQLRVAKGRGAEAKLVLQQLAATGATPTLRKRAADLLIEVDQRTAR